MFQYPRIRNVTSRHLLEAEFQIFFQNRQL